MLVRFALLVLFALPWPGSAWALESSPVTSSRAVVTLVSDTDAVAPGTPYRIGLHFRLNPGWHTYWQNPGDAGVPTQLTLDLPPGTKAEPISWPTPSRISEGPVMTYGYKGEFLLPVTITSSAHGGTAQSIHAHAEWLVCKQICIPEQGDFRLTLPEGTPGPSAQAALFAAHDQQTPRPSPWQAQITPDGSLWVRGPELRPATVADAWFIPDNPGLIQDDAIQPLSVRNDGFVLGLKLAQNAPANGSISGILSVRDRTGHQTDVALRASPGPALPTDFPPLAHVLVFAFLGGLILNLMPCVFPVLAIKAVALAQGAQRGEPRQHAAFYTAGILVTFAGLGSILLAARAAGTAAGWGFQFGSPVFVAAMAWLLFVVGLNLSGVFEIGVSLAGSGSALAKHRGRTGSFLTGILAVLVATPCTAPFMGVAIAAGLAAPPAVTIAVFLVMGFGLAVPYIVLSALPWTGRFAPRPGRWMEVLRQALAFPMYAGAAWLLWVVSQEGGPSGVLETAAGFVLLGLAAWTLGISQHAASRNRRYGQSVAAAAVLLAAAILSGVAVAPSGPTTADARDGTAEPFSPTRLAALRSEGRAVFVNMTAAWCVTCLVNERVAISTERVQQAFAAHHVAYLKGDWTRQDPSISAFLREYGRDGVPLYVYYPPHEGKPVVLPQILTDNTVLYELSRG